jgi:hypothetical protein
MKEGFAAVRVLYEHDSVNNTFGGDSRLTSIRTPVRTTYEKASTGTTGTSSTVVTSL